MSIDFQKPPVIANTGLHGTYAEGETAGGAARVTADDLVTFEYAVANYGFLVTPGRSMTGAQWCAQIAKVYDQKNPRNAEVIRTIRKVMLSDKFADDYLLVDGAGTGIYRGAEVSCKSVEEEFKHLRAGCQVISVASATPEQVDQARLDMSVDPMDVLGVHDNPMIEVVRLGDVAGSPHDVFTGTYFDLPMGYGVRVANDPKWMPRRIHDMLKCRPVGPETFTPEQGDDREASLRLMRRLMKNLGYESIVTSTGGSKGWGGTTEKRNFDLDSVEALDESVKRVFSNLVEAGWEGDKPVFLCRPAPLINPIASIRPFESMVHHQLIGWRLPKALVESYAQEARERLDLDSGRLRERQA